MLQKARLSLLLPLLGLACFLSLHLFLPHHLIAIRSVPQVNIPASPVIQHVSPDSVRIYIGVVTFPEVFKLSIGNSVVEFLCSIDPSRDIRPLQTQPRRQSDCPVRHRSTTARRCRNASISQMGARAIRRLADTQSNRKYE